MAKLTEMDWHVVKTYADCNMNKAQTAKRCYIAVNGVCYHLNKIREHTGLNPNNFYDLVKLVKLVEMGNDR